MLSYPSSHVCEEAAHSSIPLRWFWAYLNLTLSSGEGVLPTAATGPNAYPRISIRLQHPQMRYSLGLTGIIGIFPSPKGGHLIGLFRCHLLRRSRNFSKRILIVRCLGLLQLLVYWQLWQNFENARLFGLEIYRRIISKLILCGFALHLELVPVLKVVQERSRVSPTSRDRVPLPRIFYLFIFDLKMASFDAFLVVFNAIYSYRRVNKSPFIDPANQRVPGLRPWRPGPTLSPGWRPWQIHYTCRPIVHVVLV